MVLVPGSRLGPYEILSPLGAGGMGEVYRASDTSLSREVAVKILHASTLHDPDRLRADSEAVSFDARMSRPETNAYELLKETKRNIEQTDSNVSGFNVGVNNGRAAGQTVEHCHIHLIPRRVGDVANPVGGIRKAISAKPL